MFCQKNTIHPVGSELVSGGSEGIGALPPEPQLGF